MSDPRAKNYDPTKPGQQPGVEPVEMPDGSVYFPGYVIQADGTMAAETERHVGSTLSQARRTQEKVWMPSNDEQTAEAVRQIEQYQERPLPGYRSSTVDSREPPESVYGRVVNVKTDAAGKAPRQSTIVTPLEPKEHAWTVTLQLQKSLTPVGGDGSGVAGQVQATVQWMMGGVTFQKVVKLSTTIPLQFPVLGRRVMVDLEVLQSGVISSTIPVAVAVSFGEIHTVERYAPLWYPSGGLIAATFIEISNPSTYPNAPSQGPGVLMSVIGDVSAVPAGVSPTTPLWPMFLDMPPGLTAVGLAGAAPFVVSTPIGGAGQVFTFDDEFVSSLGYQKSLYLVFSTNPGTFTAPAAPPTFALNVKVGT